MFKIQDMNLYKTTDRFLNNYNHLKSSLNREPTLEEISDIDQLHYNGIEAVDEAILKTKITSKSLVLDIGSGIGGPARYLAHKTNSIVHAVELQKSLNDIAIELTLKYKLNEHVIHINGDILNYNFNKIKYNNIVSWLSLYHIPNRTKLLKTLYNVLDDKGYIYVEDFYLKKNLISSEKKLLAKNFHANHLVNLKTYKEELKKNKFDLIEYIDMSSDWTKFTQNRLLNFKKNYNKYVQINNKTTANNVLKFYNFAFDLLSNSIVGGLRYIIKKNNIIT
jgi:cyclopropane fatty-acyl-phospholipid synthase-like methyltransferase